MKRSMTAGFRNGGDDKKEDNSPSAAELRLPKSIRPCDDKTYVFSFLTVSYDLSLQAYLPSYVDFPHEKDFTFDAELEMVLDVIEVSEKIVLNMRNITINKGRSELMCLEHLFTNTSKQDFQKIDYLMEVFEIGQDFEVMPDSNLVQKNDVILNASAPIDWQNSGKGLGGEKVDIEKVVPKDNLEKVEIVPAKRLVKGLPLRAHHCNISRVAAVTQMEPIDARSMVPCFDEPEFKATWNVKIIHPKGTKAISNGLEEKK
ncbi:unnamed protein product [Strongylus vulgaris]|uniref:Aminopeptidase N-like N-terminal domain-containing protein n=1 Tax=Strongylus vulgaris TaxID=40348 RepID=A0A3P7IHZ5_STRVU|nr:unnamed protein product [Strongylus vulgaris]